jgi:hypothetical protein
VGIPESSPPDASAPPEPPELLLAEFPEVPELEAPPELALIPLEPEPPLDVDASDAADPLEPLDAPSPLAGPHGGKVWGLRQRSEDWGPTLQPAATATMLTAPVSQSRACSECQKRIPCAAGSESEDFMSEEAPPQQAYDARAD